MVCIDMSELYHVLRQCVCFAAFKHKASDTTVKTMKVRCIEMVSTTNKTRMLYIDEKKGVRRARTHPFRLLLLLLFEDAPVEMLLVNSRAVYSPSRDLARLSD